MIKILQTKTTDSSEPIMFSDNDGLAHCVWKTNGLYCYSKFNGTDWEYFNDYKIIETIPSSVEIPKNGVCIDSYRNPYILWVKPKYTHAFGSLSEMYLTYWNNDSWNLVDEKTLLEVIYGASLTFFEDDLYIGSLIFNQNRYLFTITIYQNGHFTQLNNIQISQLKEESKVIIKKIDQYIYCFWDCYDGTNKWIEHVVYNVYENTFNSTFTRKINLSNNNIPISGFEFMPLG